MKLRAPPPWASLAAIFLASLWAVHAWSGASPALWQDTQNDQSEVRRCVLEGSCSLLGQAASIDGLFVAGGWLHLRSLLFALGVGLDGVHRLLQILDALGVMLVALAGFRLGGRSLGATAAALLMLALGHTAATREAVYNTSPLAFFGALLLLASLATVERPDVWPAVVVGLLGAVMADCHTACAPAGLTAVAIALLAPGTPRRRLLRAGAAAAAFAVVAFGMAPLQWIENARFALHGGGGVGGGAERSPVALGAVAAVVRTDAIAWYATLTLLAWTAALVARRAGLRRRLDVAAAVAAPMLVAFAVAVHHGVGDSGGKYLAHVKPAVALGVAVILVEAARLLARLWPALARRLPLGARVLPWATAVAVALSARPGHGGEVIPFPLFTLDDVDAFARVLGEERGWSRARIARRVQAIDQPLMVTALLEDARVSHSPSASDDDDPTTAFLLALDVADLPDRTPPGWQVVHRMPRTAAVIVFARSRLDWRGLEMCADRGSERRCFHEPDLDADGTALPRLCDQERLTLRVPLLTGPPGRLFMPRLQGLWGGHVVTVTGPGSSIDDAGRSATLAPSAGAVELTWDRGSRECRELFARARPPFFVEGDAETVASLEALLRRHEP